MRLPMLKQQALREALFWRVIFFLELRDVEPSDLGRFFLDEFSVFKH